MLTSQDSLTTASAPDALTGHSVPIIAGADWERDGWHVSVAGAPARKYTRAEFLAEPFADVDVLLIEAAHLKERNPYSVAQVYSADELRKLASRDKIKLFPGRETYKASNYTGHTVEKSDVRGNLVSVPDKTKDPESIALYAAAHPEKLAAWKLYRNADANRALWPARDKLRDDIREAMNQIRVAWNAKPTAERYALPEVADFCALLDRNFDAIPEDVKDQFGIKRGRNGIRVERMSAAITVYLACYTREGELRLNPQGRFIGVRFILDAIGMSHSFQPNMARSQLTWHGMRYFDKKASDPIDKAARSRYMLNLRKLIQFLRDAE